MTPSSAPGRDPDAPEPKAPGRDPDVPADLQAKASGRGHDVPADLQANAPRRGRPGYDLASVLAVAVEIFNERGYDGTSMRDLADRLGIAKSAIYHHVAGKEELLRLALDRALAGLSAVTDRARVLPAPAIERLEYLVRGSVEVLEAELPYVTLLLRVRGNTEVERAALEKRRAFDRFVAELVAQAVIDGDIRPVDPMITARLLFGLVNSVVEWYRPALRTDTRSLADAICAMSLDGLRTRRNR
jgi:AcrR family transcriptional regulator